MEVADEVDRAAHGAGQRHPPIAALRKLAEQRDALVADHLEPGVLALLQLSSPRPSRDVRDRRAPSSSSRSSGGIRDRPARTAAAAAALPWSRVAALRLADARPRPREPRERHQQRPADRLQQRARRPDAVVGAAAVASIDLDELPGRRRVEPVRAHERLHERPRLRRIVLTAHGACELREMLVHRRRDVQQAAVRVLQMLEVQRAFLLSGELGRRAP